MRSRTAILLIGGAALLAPQYATMRDQTPEDQTRQIFAEEFLKARPASTRPTAKPIPRYKPANASGKPGVSATTVDVGLTLWRLRPAQPSDDGARLLVQEGTAELTADRIDTGTPLAVGDRVRLSIESPQTGWLYVIDREVYVDGTMSEAYLIFPTSRTRQGDNRVRAGRLIDIPDPHDRPNYFTVRPSRPGQAGELLTILISPAQLSDLQVGNQPVKLAENVVDSWRKSWAAPVQQFVLQGEKRPWTRQEQTAATDESRLLTQDDPAPQTIFRVSTRKGAPILLDVRLPYTTADR